MVSSPTSVKLKTTMTRKLISISMASMATSSKPTKKLSQYNIPLLVEEPDVGKDLFDHSSITQYYRIRNPENGLCAPSPAFNHPSLLPSKVFTDYIIAESAHVSVIKPALQPNFPEHSVVDNHSQVFPPRFHYEILSMYAPTEVPLTNMNILLDGSIISIGILNLLPTSRGSIGLASTNPTADPLIDTNYYATHTDRAVMRAAMRRTISMFETSEGRAIVAKSVPPVGLPALTSKSTDAESDACVQRWAVSFYHSVGTVSMDRVVHAECRVKAVAGLRVVDARVVPTPISARYMFVVYALAE
ncbi:MAG: hypothetical protein Q9175_000986 [Cornicularia normoerica]